ncbi:MAG TPA: VWA domain-containing protein, partial [Tepidisphaeraceae bacterium]
NGYGQPEEKIKVNNFADWTDSHSYLQLVIDNNRAYTPQPQSTLPPSPRFLPDILSGGTVAFLAPMTAQSMELMCAFPNARTQDGKILKPYPLTFLLEGKVSQGVTPKPIASIEDGKMFTVWFYGQKIGQTFAGKTAESGKRFVIVDVEVRNRSDTGETFQIKEQLKFLESEKNQIPPDDATYAGVYRPTELMYIPSDEQRRFEVAYQLPLEQLNPRLAYNGVTKAEVVDLVRIAPTAAKDNKHNVIAGAQTPAKPTDHQPIAAANAESKTPLPELIEVKGKRFPSRVPIKPSIKAKGLEGYGLTQEQVNAAIDKGAAGLWQVIHEEDIVKNKQKFGDQNAHMLAALALVHSDYHKKSPEFDKHLRSYMTKYDPAFDNHTYKAGLFCMLVEAYEDTAFLPQLKKATRWMIENQGKEGSWGYGVNLRDPALLGGAPPRRVLKVAGGKPLDGSDIPAPMARTTPWEKGEDGDNSVTQYAILGMHAAGRGRVKSTPELWKRALENQMSRQYENGGWAYTSGFSTYGAMTAAGVCALAISGHELGAEAPPHLQEGIERGLAWLSANFTVVDHPNGSINWKHYYLYSLERVGRILDTEFIGEHEWYPVGASHLLSTQREDGAWIGKGEEENPRYATSFALMFLTRKTATLGQEVVKTGPGTLKTAVNLPPGRKVYIILDASGSMLAEMDGRPKFEIAREAVRGLIDAFTPQTEVALRAYGYRKRATDEGASEDSAMLIPMGPIGDKKKLLDIVSGLRARGKTPLAFSLEQALSEVPAGTDDEPVTVLLLTDGGEDTQPRKDPVAASKPYAKLKNVRFRIVGFDINRQDWSDQLIAMAKAGNGMYLPAANSSALIQELKSAVFETPETFTVLNDKQQQVAAGKFGESAQLPEGKYTLKTQYADRAYEEIFWINAGMNTSVTFEAANVNAENDAASPTDAADPTSPAVEEPTPTKPPVKKPPVALPPPREVPAGKLPNPPAERKTCDQCGSSV